MKDEPPARPDRPRPLAQNEAYAGPLRDWLGEFQGGSMFILDEAHNAAPASATKYAIDSKLTRAVRDLTHRFEHKLFLSATPHNGHSNSFSAILEMLDPQKFCRGVPVHHASRDAVMIRRPVPFLGTVTPDRACVPTGGRSHSKRATVSSRSTSSRRRSAGVLNRGAFT